MEEPQLENVPQDAEVYEMIDLSCGMLDPSQNLGDKAYLDQVGLGIDDGAGPSGLQAIVQVSSIFIMF